MLPPPFLFCTDQRQKRSLTQNVIPFLNNIRFQYTNPLSFETEPHNIHTIPLAREHCDSYINILLPIQDTTTFTFTKSISKYF